MLTQKNIKPFLLVFFILTSCFMELRLLSFGKNQFGPFVSPLIVFLSGIFSGVGFLVFFYKKEIRKNFKSQKWDWKFVGLLSIIGWSGILICSNIFNILLQNNPLDFNLPSGSDVLPQINVLVTRYLSDVFPYQLITTTEWPYEHFLYPTYLPFTWLPFIVSEVFGFDYRWVAFGALIIGFIFYLKKMTTWSSQKIITLFLSLLPFLFLYAFQVEDRTGLFRFSVESLIAGYYLILSLSIFTTSNWLRGAALVLCLLSRYAIVLWIPLFFFVIFLKEKKSNTFQVGGWILVGILVFYIIPFLSQDLTIFMQGYEYHTKAAPIAWNPMSWQNENDIPIMLQEGYGLGIYFYQFWDGDSAEKLLIFRGIHLVVSCLTVFVSMLLFWKIKDRIDHRIFLLGTLKIYLVVFFNFIQIPFNYLFVTPVIISIPMIALILSHFKLKET